MPNAPPWQLQMPAAGAHGQSRQGLPPVSRKFEESGAARAGAALSLRDEDAASHPGTLDKTVLTDTPLQPPPMFLAAGGMDVVFDMMQTSDPNSQVQAAQVMFAACQGNPSNQKIVNESGGMTKVVELLRTGTTVDVKTKAANAVAAACEENRANRVQALQSNALEPLVEMLAEKGDPKAQQSAANALANVIIPRHGAGNPNQERDDDRVEERGDGETDSGGTPAAKVEEGQNALKDLGGVTKLIKLVDTGAARVKEAAAAAIANAMVDNHSNRQAFQQAGGVGPLIGLVRTGDPQAQEHATTALWNAMVDNDETKQDVIHHPQGLQVLVHVLLSGTDKAQEIAAGALWKACVAQPFLAKDRLFVAIPALVQLLKTGSPGAQTQAAGALRSACINSGANKMELNRVGGIAALVECIRSGTSKTRREAGAALANAAANCGDNQIAARHAGAVQVAGLATR